MTRTADAGISFLKAHPTRKTIPGAKYRLIYGWSWSQLCVAAVYWAIGATRSFDTANLARAHSKIVSASRDIPKGAIGWLSLGKDGHVCFGTGNSRIGGASRAWSNWGTALGDSTIEAYEEATGAKWIGWGWDFGGQEFTRAEAAHTTTAPASTGTTKPAPKPTTVPKELDMAAPLVFNYKATPTSNHWFRTWEFTIEETGTAAIATQWKAEAGQVATLEASGDDLNTQRVNVRTRVAGLKAALA